ncbi:hypothetical protein MRB53_038946 [Persea americana]|nr:hypothetical protein MRB53_038946 [Persea americana]
MSCSKRTLCVLDLGNQVYFRERRYALRDAIAAIAQARKVRYQGCGHDFMVSASCLDLEISAWRSSELRTTYSCQDSPVLGRKVSECLGVELHAQSHTVC